MINRKNIDVDERTAEEKIAARIAEFKELQERLIGVMDEFKSLNMEDVDPQKLFILCKSFPQAVDCIEWLCEDVNKKVLVEV